MQILLIFSFVIAFLAILFAIQNTIVTPIRFLIWETEGSLALILSTMKTPWLSTRRSSKARSSFHVILTSKTAYLEMPRAW